MHEENYIELDNVTIGDCLDGYTTIKIEGLL